MTHVWSNVAAAVAEAADRGRRVGVQWFDHVFDCEAGSAHVSQQFFPAVEKFERAALAMRASLHWWQRATPIIWLNQFIPMLGRLDRRLHARRLFMLRDVQSASGRQRATSR